MGSVKIDESKLNEAKMAAEEMELSIQTAYDQCETLLSQLHAAKWQGKSRDTFVSYLDIIYKYHNDLNEAVKLQTKALNNMSGYMNDFNQDSSVKEVRNL